MLSLFRKSSKHSLFVPFNSLQLKFVLGTFFSLWILLIGHIQQFSIEDGYWVASSGDDFANLYRNSQIISQPHPDPQVLIIGSSALREALQYPKMIIPKLSRINSTSVLRVLTAGDLNQVEMGQLITLLPENTHGVLFLEISERLLSLSPRQAQILVSKSRLPFASLSYQKLLIKQGLRPSFIPNLGGFYASRVQASWTKIAPKEEWRFHQVGLEGKHPKSEYPKLVKRLTKWSSLSLQHGDWNQAFFERLLQEVPKGLKVIFILPPRNPEIESLALESPESIISQKVFQERLQYFAEKHQISTISIDDKISAQNFIDHGHIWNEKAREVCTNRLLHYTSEALLQ